MTSNSRANASVDFSSEDMDAYFLLPTEEPKHTIAKVLYDLRRNLDEVNVLPLKYPMSNNEIHDISVTALKSLHEVQSEKVSEDAKQSKLSESGDDERKRFSSSDSAALSKGQSAFCDGVVVATTESNNSSDPAKKPTNDEQPSTNNETTLVDKEFQRYSTKEVKRANKSLTELGYITPPKGYYDEKSRQATLDKLKMVDSQSESSFDNIVQMASKICGVPIALITMLDHDRQWFKAKVGLEVNETPRSVSFCGHAIAHRNIEIFEIPNALEDARFKSNPLVVHAPFIRSYAGVPLHASNGQPLGTLCVINRVPQTLTAPQRELLLLLAKQVETEIELRRTVIYSLQQQQLAEVLLSSVIPSHVATALRNNATLPFAKQHFEASVMFVDIVGFSDFARKVPPDELIGSLNDLFFAFDEITSRTGLLKVKTLGDGYMVAAGVSEWRMDHATATVQTARAFICAVNQYNQFCSTKFSLRIAINSGSVVSGVLGTTKQLTFDVWGPTVNVAARLCSQSTPNRIAVTSRTKALLDRDGVFMKCSAPRSSRDSSIKYVYVKARALTSDEWKNIRADSPPDSEESTQSETQDSNETSFDDKKTMSVNALTQVIESDKQRATLQDLTEEIDDEDSLNLEDSGVKQSSSETLSAQTSRNFVKQRRGAALLHRTTSYELMKSAVSYERLTGSLKKSGTPHRSDSKQSESKKSESRKSETRRSEAEDEQHLRRASLQVQMSETEKKVLAWKSKSGSSSALSNDGPMTSDSSEVDDNDDEDMRSWLSNRAKQQKQRRASAQLEVFHKSKLKKEDYHRRRSIAVGTIGKKGFENPKQLNNRRGSAADAAREAAILALKAANSAATAANAAAEALNNALELAFASPSPSSSSLGTTTTSSSSPSRNMPLSFSSSPSTADAPAAVQLGDSLAEMSSIFRDDSLSSMESKSNSYENKRRLSNPDISLTKEEERMKLERAAKQRRAASVVGVVLVDPKQKNKVYKQHRREVRSKANEQIAGKRRADVYIKMIGRESPKTKKKHTKHSKHSKQSKTSGSASESPGAKELEHLTKAVEYTGEVQDVQFDDRQDSELDDAVNMLSGRHDDDDLKKTKRKKGKK